MRIAGKIMIVAAMTALVALAACSPSLEEPSDLPPGVDPHPPSTLPAASPGPEADHAAAEEPGEECAAADVGVAGEAGQPPEVTIPQDCAPPTTLVSQDLAEGSGATAEQGSTVELDYQVVAWSDGAVEQDTFGQDRTLTVTLGESQGFEGWDEGLAGLGEGGKRLLVVPANLGYPDEGDNALAEETLVVVAEAVSVSAP